MTISFNCAGLRRVSTMPSVVNVSAHAPTGKNTVHGTPVKSHSAPQITGMMTAMA